MPQPTPFIRGFNFSDFQSNTPSTPLPGPMLDGELDDAAKSIADILTNLALIQRDDGKLVNELVDLDAIDDSVLYAIAAAIITYVNAPNPVFSFNITTLAPGAAGTAAVSGNYPNLTVELGLPKGDAAEPGAATLANGDYGDVAVSLGGSHLVVETVLDGEVPSVVGHVHSIADITGLQAELDSLGGAQDWANITNKPLTFPPSEHNHDGLYYGKAAIDQMLAAKQPAGSYATTAQLNAKADAITTVKSFANNQAVSDAGHNGCYNLLTGSVALTVTFGNVSAGHTCIWVNRGTVNMTIVCNGGYYKNGAVAPSVGNLALAPGGKITAFHEGGGVWTFDGVGI